MKILIATSEVHPFSKSGGLADMVGALGKTLASLNHKVGIVSPLYRGIREKFPKLRLLDYRLRIQLGGAMTEGRVWSLKGSSGEQLYFIAHDEFFDRPAYYTENGRDYADNDRRFVFFSKAVAHLAQNLPWHPDVVHAHDWQAGLAPLLIRHATDCGFWPQPPATVLTIHNLAYQGVFPVSSYALTNLPQNYFNYHEVEFHGRMNCLKAGIVFSDSLTTVSPRYAREITTKEFGCGLDAALRDREEDLAGILNGVDYSEWNTIRNPLLPAPYDSDDLSGKSTAKSAVQAELGLPVRADAPLFGNVSRLAEQKGVDICLGALEEMLSADIQFALLGSGQPEFEKAFRELATRHPGKVGVRIGYDHGLAHRIEAGSDFFLMPSRFEPCGLNQMYSLRYGSIPIVRATGGLDDSIIDATQDPSRPDGIKFHDYSAAALAKAMRKALVIFENPEVLAFYRQNGMTVDFSWSNTAAEYLRAYKRAREKSAAKIM